MLEDIHKYTVWSRMQTEAGEGLDRILFRKELERLNGDGQYFWGVGNPPPRMIPPIADNFDKLPVVFSKMSSKPKRADVSPSGTVVWRKYVDLYGNIQALPKYVLLTSRASSEKKRKLVHYALICQSEKELVLDHNPPLFDHKIYKNVSGNGAPVGASQVTSLVQLSTGRLTESKISAKYHVDIRANLIGSMWVKLVDPYPVAPEVMQFDNIAQLDSSSWIQFVSNIRCDEFDSPIEQRESQGSLPL